MGSLYKRGKIWWGSIYRNGERVFLESLETEDKAVAKEKLRLKEAEIIKGSTLPSSKLRAIDILNEYEKDCKTRNEAKTVHDDIKRIKDFLKKEAVNKLSDINIRVVSSYLNDRIAAGIKKTTANRTIDNLKTWLNYCVDHEYIGVNPLARLKRYKKLETNPVRFYTKEQIEALLAAAHDFGPEYFKLVAIGVFTGVRISELLSLEWQDFDFERNVVTVRNKTTFRTKSRKFRVIPLNARLCEILRPFKKASGLCVFPERTFINPPDHLFYPIQKKAGLPKEGFHVMRHTFGSRLAQEGVSPKKIKEWMGHSSLRMTEIYLHLLPQHDSDINKI